MTVQELIVRLQAFAPDTEIMIRDPDTYCALPIEIAVTPKAVWLTGCYHRNEGYYLDWQKSE